MLQYRPVELEMNRDKIEQSWKVAHMKRNVTPNNQKKVPGKFSSGIFFMAKNPKWPPE